VGKGEERVPAVDVCVPGAIRDSVTSVNQSSAWLMVMSVISTPCQRTTGQSGTMDVTKDFQVVVQSTTIDTEK
jgi:hypothetical protein